MGCDWYAQGGIFEPPEKERLVGERSGRSEYKGHPLPEGFAAIAMLDASVEIKRNTVGFLCGIPLFEPWSITVKADEINSVTSSFQSKSESVECIVLVRQKQVCQNADNPTVENAAIPASESASRPAQTCPLALGA